MTNPQNAKKRKVVPPMAPRAAALRSSLGTPMAHKRAQILPEVEREHTPSSGRYVRAPGSYPTPESAERWNLRHMDLSASSQNRMSSLDFEAPTTPQSNLETAHSLSDSEDASITDFGSPKRKKPYPRVQVELDDIENEPSKIGSKGKGKAKPPLEFGSDSEVAGSSADKDDSGEEHVDQETGPKLPSRSGTPKTGPSTHKVEYEVKVEDKDSKPVKDDGEVGEGYRKQIIRLHVLRRMLEVCGLNHARDAYKLVPEFDAGGRPKHFVGNILVPHFGNSFNNEWAIWGGRVLGVLREVSRMGIGEQPILLAASDNDLQKAVQYGVYATMRTAWKKHQGGNGEVWIKGRKDSTRQWGRKNEKGIHRLGAAEKVGLSVENFGFIGDRNAQSDEEDDPKNVHGRIVKVPEFRTDEVNDLMAALSVAHDSMKERVGNPKVNSYKYVKVNVPVPKIKGKGWPQWAISKPWEDANPQLALESRTHIDPEQTVTPEADKLKKLIHRYGAKKRTYEALLPIVTSTSVPTNSSLASHLPVAKHTPTTLAKPALVPAPALESPPTSAHIPTSAPCAHPNDAAIEAQDLLFVRATAEPQVPTVVSPSLEPGMSNVLFQPNPNIGVHPTFATSMSPGLHQSSYAPGTAQPILMRSANGEPIWVWPMYQPTSNQSVLGVQANGSAGAHSDFIIDPSLLGESALQNSPPNMPPPPELTEPTQETPQRVSLPAKRGRGRGSRGGGKGKSTSGRGQGRPAKSKAVIEEDKEGGKELDLGEEAIPGPPQQVPKASKVQKVMLTVRGS